MPESDPQLIASGVPGLDTVLGGGLRPGHLYFLEGEPGTGKTTLALQFVLEGARRGERCLFISLAESAEEIRIVADAHGWSLEGVEVRDLTEVEHGMRPTTLFELSEVELGARMDALLAELQTLRPQRLVLDALSALRVMSTQAGELRRHVELFRARAREVGATTLVADDLLGEQALHPRSLAWGILRLEQRAGDYGPTRRRLWVPKLRGQRCRAGYHDLRIDTGGLLVFPRLVAKQEPVSWEHAQVSTGMAEIDRLLGGGLERGTSVGIIGPPGCGKSTLATLLALACAGRGERVAFCCFDESLDTFRLRAAGQGLELEPHLEAGRVVLRKFDPAELAPGELACELAREVSDNDTRLVVIDSLNGYLQAMPHESFMNLHVHGLLSYLGECGVLSVLTLAQPSALNRQDGLAVDLSFLTDTVVAQRYFEAYGTIRYALSVLKKRYGEHERTIREYRLGKGGIAVGEPLDDFRGVLSGSPEYVGDREPLL